MTTTHRPSYVIATAEVIAVHRLSPSFVRVTFGGDDLHDLGTPGDVYDARIKLILPPASQVLPPIDRGTDSWWDAYRALPDDERGVMRTYSIRHLRVEDDRTEIDIDFVLHLSAGATGPAAEWADTARPGRRILIVGPRRGRLDRSGIEYAPGDAERVLLAGDETAAPAIARILEDCPPTTRGTAFIEVPVAADVLPIEHPAGVTVHWLPRDGAPHGALLIPRVADHLGDPGADTTVIDIDGDEPAWETPAFSRYDDADRAASGDTGDYFWIAGESGVVTTIRRHLVTHRGIDRSRVAFMGYWRRGAAKRV